MPLTLAKELTLLAHVFPVLKSRLNSFFAVAKLTKKRNSQDLLPPSFQELYRVDRAGAHIFKILSRNELLERNKSLLHHLRLACDFSSKIQMELMWPLIERTASFCNCLPASEGAHDPDPGGLFRHSLTVALNAISNVRNITDYKERERLKLCILWASLTHDLGKILTDFVISSDEGIAFDPLHSSLEDFAHYNKCLYLRVQFKLGRGRNHDHCRALRNMMFSRDDLHFFSYLNDVEESSNLLNGTHIAWELVAMADSLSVAMSSSRGGKYLAVPDFIISWIRRKLLAPMAANTFEADFMLLPSEYGGILLRQGSQSYKHLLSELKNFYNDETGVRNLRSSGSAALAGRGRFFSWYRIEFDDGRCLYVKGVLIRIKYQDEERARFAEINICERGSCPLEIRDIIKNDKSLCSCQKLADGSFVPVTDFERQDNETNNDKQDLYAQDLQKQTQFSASRLLQGDLSVSEIAHSLENMPKHY